jgi:hypothetical protein
MTESFQTREAEPGTAVHAPDLQLTPERAALLRRLFDEEAARRGLPPLEDLAADGVR